MSEGAGQGQADSKGFDPKTLEAPAKALVAGNVQGGVVGLVSAAATAATANPFFGIAAGGAANWLWAKVAARSATAKLKAAAEGELAALNGAQVQAEMKACVIEALREVRPQDATEAELAEAKALAAELGKQTELRPQDLESIADTIEEGLGQVLRRLAELKEDHEQLKGDHAQLKASHGHTHAQLDAVHQKLDGMPKPSTHR